MIVQYFHHPKKRSPMRPGTSAGVQTPTAHKREIPFEKKNAEAIPGRDFTYEVIPGPVLVVITGTPERKSMGTRQGHAADPPHIRILTDHTMLPPRGIQQKIVLPAYPPLHS
jgi:hypothetical protein